MPIEMNILSHMSSNSGIYKITSPTGKVYIGQALNIRHRLKRYFRLECKRQYKLYNSFIKYGVENHKFEVIEECEVDNLFCRERYWQDEFDVLSEKGMNLTLSSCDDKKRVWSEEVKQGMIHKLKQRYLDGEIPAFKGKKHTEYSKKLMSDSRTGSGNHSFGKTGEKAYVYGLKHSVDTKEKMSQSRSGGKSPTAKIIIDESTGIYYEYVGELAELLNIPRSTLASKLNGHRKNNTNFKYC